MARAGAGSIERCRKCDKEGRKGAARRVGARPQCCSRPGCAPAESAPLAGPRRRPPGPAGAACRAARAAPPGAHSAPRCGPPSPGTRTLHVCVCVCVCARACVWTGRDDECGGHGRFCQQTLSCTEASSPGCGRPLPGTTKQALRRTEWDGLTAARGSIHACFWRSAAGVRAADRPCLCCCSGVPALPTPPAAPPAPSSPPRSSPALSPLSYTLCMWSPTPGVQKKSGVSSTLPSRLSAACSMNTRPMSCATALSLMRTCRGGSGGGRGGRGRLQQLALCRWRCSRRGSTPCAVCGREASSGRQFAQAGIG